MIYIATSANIIIDLVYWPVETFTLVPLQDNLYPSPCLLSFLLLLLEPVFSFGDNVFVELIRQFI